MRDWIDRRAGILLAVALAGVCAVTVVWRVSGIDPESLFLDDQWVAIAIRKMSWVEFFTLKPPVPVGFVALARVAAWVSSDPEWPLQLLPVVCSIAVVPAAALAASRLSDRRSTALLAGTLLAVSPWLGVYAVTVKQYASDALVAAILLWLGLPLLTAWRRGRALALAVAGALLLFVSFPSIFVSFPLMNLSAIRAWHGRRADATRPGRAASAPGLAAAFDLVVALVYGLYLGHLGSPAMVDYWQPFFLPVTSAVDLWHFLTTNGRELVAGALPESIRWAGLLIVPGLASLLWQRRTRLAGVFFLLFYVELFVASALRVYPLGSHRTDIFSHVVTLVLVATGVHALTRHRAIARPAGVVVCLLAAALLLLGQPSRYRNSSNDAALVADLERAVSPDDALLIYPRSMFAVGYYGNWAIGLRPWPGYAHGFEVTIDRPRTMALSAMEGYEDRPERLSAELDPFLDRGYPRIVFFTAGVADGRIHVWIQRRLVARGYGFAGAYRQGETGPELNLLLFVRRE